MKPGDSVEFHRGGPALFTGRVLRIAPRCGDAIVGDIHHLDGRLVLATSIPERPPLTMRVGKGGAVKCIAGVGGELRCRVAS